MTDPETRRWDCLAQVGRVARLVWAERRTYLTGTIFVVVSIGTALAYPQVIRLIIDEGIHGGQAQRLNQLSLWMVVILLVEAAAHGRARLLLRPGRRARRRPVAPHGVRDAAPPGHPVLRPPRCRRNHHAPVGRRAAAGVRARRGVRRLAAVHRVQRAGDGAALLHVAAADAAHAAGGAADRPRDVGAGPAGEGAVGERPAGARRGRRGGDRGPGRHPHGARVLAGAAESARYDASVGARARVRPPEDSGAGAARRRVADRRRVRGAARHLGGRPSHRRRPHDHRRADLVHPLRAARRPRIPQRVAVHRRIAASRRRHAVGLRAARSGRR